MKRAATWIAVTGAALLAPACIVVLDGVVRGPQPLVITPRDYLIVVAVPAAALLGALLLTISLIVALSTRVRRKRQRTPGETILGP